MDSLLRTFSELLVYDRTTGQFYWRVKRNGYGGGVKPGDKAGRVAATGHVTIGLLGRRYYAHHLAWLFEYGEWPEFEIDHINGRPAVNKIANLRDVPHKINIQNQRRARTDNKSGYLGVHARGNSWRAEIVVDGKAIRLGKFSSAILAHRAYLEAKRQVHSGCTI